MAEEDIVITTKQQKGKIVKGPPALTKPVPGYKPVSSIPAKFETVLYTGAREKKGFLTEQRRFHDQEHDLPGPGAYELAKKSLVYKHDSIGKKGFGPMASASARFKRRVVYTGPGPGEYRHRDNLDVVAETYFNKAEVTAAFHEKVERVKAITKKEEAQPGPGEYGGAGTLTRHGQKLDLLAAPQSHRSAFKATPHKLTLLGNPESPPPNHYDLGDLWDGSAYGSKAARGPGSFAGGAGTASFASPSVTSLANVPNIIFTEENDPKKRTDPGPGHYEPGAHCSIRSKLERECGKASAAFQPQEFTDRFGAPLQRRPDGPPAVPNLQGDAPARQPSPPVNTAHSAVQRYPPMGTGKAVQAPFRSQTAGHAEYDLQQKGGMPAPGPAYYQPALPPAKKSFHLNARKVFVQQR